MPNDTPARICPSCGATYDACERGIERLDGVKYPGRKIKFSPCGCVVEPVDIDMILSRGTPRQIPTSPKAAASALKTWHLSEGGVPRCNACGYSERDCALHLDHHRCPNPDPPAKEAPDA